MEEVCTLSDYIEIYLVLNNAFIFKNYIALKKSLNPKDAITLLCSTLQDEAFRCLL